MDSVDSLLDTTYQGVGSVGGTSQGPSRSPGSNMSDGSKGAKVILVRVGGHGG